MAISTSSNYAAWLESLKTQIRTARVKASLAVNRELVLLYWRLGKEILARQTEQGWGTKVIEQLAKDLKAEPVGWAEKPNTIRKPNPTRCLVLGFLRQPNLRIRLFKMADYSNVAGVFDAYAAIK